MKIGFFGLGEMGASIAERLLICGHEILATKRGRYRHLQKNDNFKLYEDPCSIADDAEIIIFCVDTIENLEKIVFSDNGLLKSKNLPDYFFDFGTGKPSFCKKLYDEFLKYNKSYIDMPIGRTPSHALEGKLNLFISSEDKNLSGNIDLIKQISENQFFVGDVGEGTKLKLVNNFYGQAVTFIFGNLLMTCNEQKINQDNLVRIMSAGPLYSGILDAIKPYFNENEVGSVEFSIDNALKDLNYFNDEFVNGDDFVDLIISYFQKAVDHGYGKKSVAEISKYVNR